MLTIFDPADRGTMCDRMSRRNFLKIGALVTRSVRRIRVAMASSCPDAAVFRLAHARLCG